MIIVQNISKSFGKKGEVHALVDIDLDVKEGELFGLIGPDGAGKTTLFRILTTLILADSGSASVAGLDVVKDFKALRKILGYMPGKFSLYQDLTVAENLEFYASIFNTTVEANYRLIKDIYVQLEPFKDRRAGALSGGMKQKLALCCSLIHKPTVLFLDEPTTGVDVVSRKEFWEMLRRLKKEGITIFVSTPYMDEAALCDKIALIQNGKILSTNTPDGLVKSFKYTLIRCKSNLGDQVRKDLLDHPILLDVYSFGEYIHGKLALEVKDIIAIQRYLESLGHHDVVVEIIQPTIEDCFLDLLTNG